MYTWIALFRGINVGGRNRLPMADLRADLEGLGHRNVRTCIQSGNVVFDSFESRAAVLVEEIRTRLEARRALKPDILLLTQASLRRAVAKNPFATEAEGDPKTVHFLFLSETPDNPALADLEKIRAPEERFQLTPEVFYLHAPRGLGHSKLAARAEKYLGITATGRNFRTVMRILDLVSRRP